MQKALVSVAAAIEVPTGLVLIFAPSVFTQLLFTAKLAGAGQALAPLAGFALIALAIACWPPKATPQPPVAAVRALLSFSLLCTFYLASRGLSMDPIGPLLWPAAAGHGLVSAALLWCLLAVTCSEY